MYDFPLVHNCILREILDLERLKELK